MIVYKLTDRDMRTYNGYQWTWGKVHTASGEGELCSSGWLHAYESPLLAVLHSPIHANIDKPLAWIADTLNGTILRDGKMKLGSTKMVLLEEIDIPQVTLTQCVSYGILCALAVTRDAGFIAWANNWLSGEDRSKVTAAVVARNLMETEPNTAWVMATLAMMAETQSKVAWMVAIAAKRAAAGKSLDLAEIANAAMAY